MNLLNCKITVRFIQCNRKRKSKMLNYDVTVNFELNTVFTIDVIPNIELIINKNLK